MPHSFPLTVSCDRRYRFPSNNLRQRNIFLIFFVLYALSYQLAYAEKYNQLSQKAQQMLTVCQGCHGEKLSGQEKFNAPAIAGQSLLYLTRQIAKFRDGARGKHKEDSTGQQMASIALTLNDSESLLEVNQYISELRFIAEHDNLADLIASKVSVTTQQLRQGSNYYQGKCGACHGGNAQGNDKMLAPRLNHLSPAYLLKQMTNFSNDIRGGDADDKYGRQMAMMAKMSAGQELSNIIMFINHAGMKANVSADHE